ncbi:hypothetical protein Hdeb2414_s0018g00528431 [Helianthus debilis subsp. tardiflorus]
MVVWWWCNGDGQRGNSRHCFSPVRSSGGHSHTAPKRDGQCCLFILQKGGGV